MKKVSVASLVVGIILVILAIVACAYGFCYIDGYRTYYMNAWRQMTTVFNTSNLGLGLVIAGGFLFIGGILLLMLSALVYCKKAVPAEEKQACCCKNAEPEAEPKQETEAAPQMASSES